MWLQWALMAWTIVSAPVVTFLGVGFWLRGRDNDRLNRYVTRLEHEKEHGGMFHRCPDHRNTGLYNAAESNERVDLTDIGKRWRDAHQNRID